MKQSNYETRTNNKLTSNYAKRGGDMATSRARASSCIVTSWHFVSNHAYVTMEKKKSATTNKQ